MATVPNVNKGDAKTRQALLQDPANDREPLRDRPVQEDQVPRQRHFVDPDGTVTRTSHKPGTPRPEEPAPTRRNRREAAKRQELETAQAEVHYSRETSPAERVYAERPNIVHPGPTVEALVTAEEAAGEPLPADLELVLGGVNDPLEPGETAEERLEARREAVRAERLA